MFPQEEHCYVALDKPYEDSLPELPIERKYELPDGQIVSIGKLQQVTMLTFGFIRSEVLQGCPVLLWSLITRDAVSNNALQITRCSITRYRSRGVL